MRRSIIAIVGLAWTLAVGCGMPPVDVTPPDATSAPTYHEDVAPLLARACEGCHRDEGSAPFPLVSYEDAAGRAADLVRATSTRRMPPWPADASGACNTFLDSRWLTDEEIALIAAWHDAGAPRGDVTMSAPRPPVAMQPFEPAVTLAATSPYTVAATSGVDEYRCFVVDPGLPAADVFITAMRVVLDRADIVHHVQLFASDDDATDADLASLESADAAPGYACGEEGLAASVRYVGVWAAGDLVRRWAPGTGIRLRGGHRLVLQLHYHNHGATSLQDHTRVELELASTVDQIGDIHHARNLGLFLLPGQPQVTTIGSHGLGIETSAWARGARIHMHRLGVSARMELVRDGQATCLLSIPRWDFGWQLFYMFTEPIPVEPGDEIRVSCSYDTRGRSEPVTWGLGTDDEMCIGYTYFTH